jgi:hypothetical protein
MTKEEFINKWFPPSPFRKIRKSYIDLNRIEATKDLDELLKNYMWVGPPGCGWKDIDEFYKDE